MTAENSTENSVQRSGLQISNLSSDVSVNGNPGKASSIVLPVSKIFLDHYFEGAMSHGELPLIGEKIIEEMEKYGTKILTPPGAIELQLRGQAIFAAIYDVDQHNNRMAKLATYHKWPNETNPLPEDN